MRTKKKREKNTIESVKWVMVIGIMLLTMDGTLRDNGRFITNLLLSIF